MKRLLIMLIILLVFLPSRQVAQGKPLTQERFARLARGTNLTGWFWYAPPTDQGVRQRFDPAEFAQLRAIGLTFVRIPLDLSFVHDETQPTLLNEAHILLLEEGITQIHTAGLATIIDLHSTSLEDSDNANYSGKLEDPAFAEQFIAFWSSFASRLSSFDPELTIFGPMNEPVFQDDPTAWLPLQERLITAIRASAPEHTIIATAALWSGMGELMSMEPLADPNIVYDFHFYDPMPFTHQGATWSAPVFQRLRDVPYPSDPAVLASVVERHSDPEARTLLTSYGEERWNSAALDNMITDVAWWADQNNVQLICAEFGVLRDYADPQDRARWLTDVRTILESYGIGWAMWDYDANFGLATRSGAGKVVLDELTVNALGLTMP